MKHKIICCSVVVLLFAAVVSARTKTTREQVIAEVERLGGKVEFDETKTNRPIIKVDLHSTKVADADLQILKDLKEIQILDL